MSFNFQSAIIFDLKAEGGTRTHPSNSITNRVFYQLNYFGIFTVSFIVQTEKTLKKLYGLQALDSSHLANIICALPPNEEFDIVVACHSI